MNETWVHNHLKQYIVEEDGQSYLTLKKLSDTVTAIVLVDNFVLLFSKSDEITYENLIYQNELNSYGYKEFFDKLKQKGILK